MRRIVLYAALATMIGGVAIADAPERSLRPAPRDAPPEMPAARPVPFAAPGTIPWSSRAPVQGKNEPTKVFSLRRAPRGTVCGDGGIKGSPIPRIRAEEDGCGLSDGVSVTAVDGIPLSTPASIDCTTAKTLKYWVEKVARPAVGRHGGGLAQLQVAAHYACRSRNNQDGARMSEHGKGRAIDISGFVTRDGKIVTVLDHWGSERYGRLLAALRKGACGPFGTVLGPGSDGFHRDHFHFDTARYRDGAYCR